jgi:hypothetical protein
VTDQGTTAVAEPLEPGEPRERDADLVLARVHLRLGSLGLARAELETLAGRGSLDDDGVRDLAEARWRTGDIAGAGEAAAAWLEVQPDDIVGLVIAAEAQAAAGRPGEARRLAGKAMERAEGSLDPVFAGMPRSSVWPVEPGADGGPAGLLFDDLHPGPVAVPAAAGPTDRGEDEARWVGTQPLDGPGLWGDEASPEAIATDPAELVRGARASLDAGRPDDAAAGLLLALRASPAIAPAVLDLLAGRSEPILAVVRGDAARVVGHDLEAMRDHAAATASLAGFGDQLAIDATEDEAQPPAIKAVSRRRDTGAPGPTSDIDPTDDQENP